MTEYQTPYGQKVGAALLMRSESPNRLAYALGSATSAMWAFRQAASLVSDAAEREKVLAHATDFAAIMARCQDEMELYAATVAAIRQEQADE